MIGAAFFMGLLGSMHCAGMCGPLSLMLPERGSAVGKVGGLLLYNLARILVYAFLGMLTGWAGYLVSLSGAGAWLMLASALILLISGLFSLFSRDLLERIPLPASWMNRLRQLFRPLFRQKNYWSYVGMGAFNALIPCGLLYTSLLAAVAEAHPLQSAGFMLMFGLGTVPAMMSAQYLLQFVKQEWRIYLRRALPLLSIVLAFFLVYRSGIVQGYLAPEPAMTECR